MSPHGSATRALRRSVLSGVGLIGALLLVTLLAGQARSQQPEADVFVAQAILAYEEKRYEDALAAIREALALDPNNVDALYYGGLVRLALGRLEEAAAAFERARTLDPSDEAVLFQLGVTYFSQGKYDQAEGLLEQVFAAKPTLDSLGYYVGFMRYRKKDYQGALRAFRAGATIDPDVQQLTRFYSGLAFGILGLPERAAAEIEEALRLHPASPLTGPAERVREAVVAARQTERRFKAEVRVGAFYDDNVPVQPGEGQHDSLVESLRAHERRSWGELASLRLDYSFLRVGSLEATLTYSFFGNYNNDLPAFNVVDHLGALGTTYRGTVGALPYQASLQYSYDYLILDDDEFTQRQTVTSSGALVEDALNLTALQLRYQRKQYSNDTNIAREEKRDGSNWMAGITHIFRFEGDKHLIKLGYQWDFDDTRGPNDRGRNFAYFGSRVLAGAQYTLPWRELRLKYDFDVHVRDYRYTHSELPVGATQTKERLDKEWTHVVGFTLPLPNNLNFVADYQGTLARSNLDAFTFSRRVLSLYFVWSY